MKTFIGYETRYIYKGKPANYRTKKLTPFHKHLHEQFKATTLYYDGTSWAFGPYAEVVDKKLILSVS